MDVTDLECHFYFKQIMPNDICGAVLFRPFNPDKKYFTFFKFVDYLETVKELQNAKIAPDIKATLTAAMRLTPVVLGFPSHFPDEVTFLFGRVPKGKPASQCQRVHRSICSSFWFSCPSGVHPAYLSYKCNQMNCLFDRVTNTERLAQYEREVHKRGDLIYCGFDHVKPFQLDFAL